MVYSTALHEGQMTNLKESLIKKKPLEITAEIRNLNTNLFTKRI